MFEHSSLDKNGVSKTVLSRGSDAFRRTKTENLRKNAELDENLRFLFERPLFSSSDDELKVKVQVQVQVQVIIATIRFSSVRLVETCLLFGSVASSICVLYGSIRFGFGLARFGSVLGWFGFWVQGSLEVDGLAGQLKCNP